MFSDTKLVEIHKSHSDVIVVNFFRKINSRNLSYVLNFLLICTFSLLGILMGAVIKIIEFKKLANWKVGLPNCSFFNISTILIGS